jgi:hypothetical protein
VWVILPGAVAGCGGAPPADRAAAPEKPGGPAAVPVVRPQRGAVRRVVEQPGTIQAFEETEL